MSIAIRPLITIAVLLTILPAIRVPSSHAASHNARPAILSQLRLVPNPAGADASTDGSNRLIWTSRTGEAVLYDLRTKRATVVATSQAAGGSVAPAMIRGHWLAYIDDPESRWTGTRWILKVKDLRTGKIQIIGRADPAISPQFAEGLRPTIALSKTALVWNDWRKVGGKIEARVHILYLNTQRSRVLARSTSDDLLDVAVSGKYAAWSRLGLAPGAQASTASSTLWLDYLPAGKITRIDVGKGASEASMWGPYLVYKASITRYENGNVYLYDMRSGRTTQLTNSSPRGEVDAPSVGASVVAWNGMGTIGAYDLATRHRISLHPGDGGRGYTAGHILIYVASTNPKAPEYSPYALVIDRFRSPQPLRCASAEIMWWSTWMEG